jgi:hypothetical protein
MSDPPVIELARAALEQKSPVEMARIKVLAGPWGSGYIAMRNSMVDLAFCAHAAHSAYRQSPSEANAIALQQFINDYEEAKRLRDENKRRVIASADFQTLLQFYGNRVEDALNSL